MKCLSFKKKLFGNFIEIKIYNYENLKKTQIILDDLYVEALRLQKIFNFYDEESELSHLNEKRRMKVSKDLIIVLKEAIKFSKLTHGKYDVTLGEIFDRRKKGKRIIKQNCSYEDIKIKGNEVELLNPLVRIDLGSIAKGYITDRLADFLEVRGLKEFLIDSRGDIIVHGNSEHVLGIQNPRGKNSLFNIKLRNKSIATSGDYNQYYGSCKKSHIINSKEIISITVMGNSLALCDVLATAMFVSSEEERKKIMSKYGNYSIFLIKSDLNEEFYNKFGDYIYEK